MKILFLYERKIIPTFGGVERVTYLLAEEFRRRGHAVAFLSVGPSDWNGEDVDYGFPQYYIPRNETDFDSRLHKLTEAVGTEVIIFQGNHNMVVSALSKVPEGIRKFIVLHYQPHILHGKERRIMRLTPWKGLETSRKVQKILGLTVPRVLRVLNTKKNNRRYRQMAENADKFIFLSERSVERLKSITPGLDPSKLAAVNNPLTFSPETIEAKEDEKENLVVNVSRLSNPQKNITGFIDAWKIFSASHPGWKAMVVGDGEHREYIESYARKKGVGKLTFEGNRNDVEAYYRKAKILCMTSAYEGWGMVLVEAMAYGCVPVAFDSYEAVHDIIHSGENGLLAKAFNAKDMARKIALIAENEGLRKEMARRGAESITKFDVSNIADRWEMLFAGQ